MRCNSPLIAASACIILFTIELLAATMSSEGGKQVRHRRLTTIVLIAVGIPNVAVARRGYAGPGGPCYAGPGGGLYAGPGGSLYAGPEGGLYAGPGGGLYAGPGGGMYAGPGGGLYKGPGGGLTQVRAAEFIRDRPEDPTLTRVLGVRALLA